MRQAKVYTETVVHAAPERFAAEAPYQVAIVELADGGRLTARVTGERVGVDDMVIEVESDSGIPYFQKI